MGKLLALLGSWHGYVACAVLSALLATAATATVYRLTIAQMERDQASAALVAANNALSQFTADANAIHGAAVSFGGIRDELGSKLATISRDFDRATKAAPLPADCKPDVVRLRALANAVAATNSAAGLQPGAAVPGRP